MPSFNKLKLSNSTDGKQITITTDAFSTGNNSLELHQSLSSTTTTEWDEIWIYVCNVGSGPLELEMQWGRADSSTNTTVDMKVNIPDDAGYILVAPGLILQNSLQVRARCDSSGLYAIGYVNRIQ